MPLPNSEDTFPLTGALNEAAAPGSGSPSADNNAQSHALRDEVEPAIEAIEAEIGFGTTPAPASILGRLAALEARPVGGASLLSGTFGAEEAGIPAPIPVRAALTSAQFVVQGGGMGDGIVLYVLSAANYLANQGAVALGVYLLTLTPAATLTVGASGATSPAGTIASIPAGSYLVAVLVKATQIDAPTYLIQTA